MVVEYIRYKVPAPQREDFESAWATAQTVLDTAPECLSHEVARGVEEPDNYIVRLEWASLDDHEHGFRGGPLFAPFFARVRPFVGQIEEMRHYDPLSIAAPTAS